MLVKETNPQYYSSAASNAGVSPALSARRAVAMSAARCSPTARQATKQGGRDCVPVGNEARAWSAHAFVPNEVDDAAVPPR